MKYAFGYKIREVRERRKMTLKETAARAEISDSLLSQIERDQVSPAIETLLRILDVLEIDMEYIFRDYKRPLDVHVVRREERRVYTMEQVRYELFSSLDHQDPEHGIEAYFMELPPGQERGSTEYGHMGQEMGIILEGTATFYYGSEVTQLEAGDSISYQSTIPHRLVNQGDKTVKSIWIITPPRMFQNT